MAKKDPAAAAANEQPVNTTPQNAVDPAAEAEKILAEAREKAAEIVAAAEKEAQAKVEAAKTPNTKGGGPEKPAGPRMVTVQLFKDSERYKDDVDVAVNGVNYRIRRGEPVQVPYFVAEVLERSMKQDAATAEMISQKSAEYEAQAKALNI